MTALYAEYTAGTPEDVARQVADRHARERASYRNGSRLKGDYKLLPWSMEELPGTTWRNAHTFVSTTIEQLKTDRFGKIGPDPDEHSNILFSIGLWRGKQFCIEHWVRVDHLPPLVQQKWAIERVRYCREELRRKRKEDYNSDACHKMNVKWAEKYLAEARQELAELTERLGLQLALNIRNVGACAGDQLVML